MKVTRMEHNLNKIFEGKKFNKNSSGWTVIIIASVISLILVFSFLQWGHSAQSKKAIKPSTHITSHIVTPPLTEHTEPPITQAITPESTPVDEVVPEVHADPIAPKPPSIYKCKSAGNTVYSEAPCPSGSDNEDIKIVDSASDASRFRNYINQPRQAQKSEVTSATAPELMSQHAINERTNELESAIRSISSSDENIAASNEELAYMRKAPKRLSNEDEIKRRSYRIALDRLDDDARYKAWTALKNEIYSKY
ncbi:hypothetical protein A7981_04460 [Methylovorus sp. MM2]|nr:hypothetical protein A7981_04460 [Methylovorus sp. MM2]